MVLLCPPRVSVLYKFWKLYSGVNGNLLQEDLIHTHTKSSCPCSRPLPTCTSTGDAQSQFCLSLCGVPGSWCTQGLFEPSELLWRERGLILNANLPPYSLAGASPLSLDMGYLLPAAPVPTGVFLTLAVGYLHLAGSAKLSLYSWPWTWGSGTWYVPAIYFWHEWINLGCDSVFILQDEVTCSDLKTEQKTGNLNLGLDSQCSSWDFLWPHLSLVFQWCG